MNSKHTLKQADYEETAPYRLGAAQLEAGRSYPMGLQRSLPPLERARGASEHNYVNLF